MQAAEDRIAARRELDRDRRGAMRAEVHRLRKHLAGRPDPDPEVVCDGGVVRDVERDHAVRHRRHALRDGEAAETDRDRGGGRGAGCKCDPGSDREHDRRKGGRQEASSHRGPYALGAYTDSPCVSEITPATSSWSARGSQARPSQRFSASVSGSSTHSATRPTWRRRSSSGSEGSSHARHEISVMWPSWATVIEKLPRRSTHPGPPHRRYSR